MLTEKRIREAKPTGKTFILWDKQVIGLGVRVTKTGFKSYVVNYRDAGGKERRTTLARASEISLREARERAGATLAAIRAGESDPVAQRREAREAPTVNEALDRFFSEYCPKRMEAGRMTQRTADEYRRQATRNIRPTLGRYKVAAVERRHIEKLLNGIAAPITRNRVQALLSRLFNQFEAWELRPMGSNPCRRIEKARENARERILNGDELAALNGALDEEPNPIAVAAIRVAAMSGLRISEILAMRWEHIDFEAGRVKLPRTKTGARSHDLGPAALTLIDGLPRIHGNPHVFASRQGSAIVYRTVHDAFARAVERAGLSDVRVHDLRRTALTTAAASGLSPFMVRELAGHKTLAMANRYVQMAGTDPVKAAREQVDATMAAMLKGESGEVVNIGGRKSA